LRRGLWQMSTSMTKLSKCWAFKRTFTICWETLDGCNFPMDWGKHPQGVGPVNSYDHGADT
jgi:hypothetical protein